MTKSKTETKAGNTEAAKVIDSIAAKPASATAQKKQPDVITPKKPAISKAAKPVAPVAAKLSPAKPAAKAPAGKNPKIADKALTPTKPAKEIKTKKSEMKKPKLIRDSFTFPEAEYALFALLKQKALQAGREVKKSELLRAGLAALANMSKEQLIKALAGVESIKTGRPSKK
ncbi:MAG: hypothetical protein H6R18_2322 [Proteobacteria bacterium]|nr:hypothetical protein [Pseudomonadota bacterium]